MAIYTKKGDKGNTKTLSSDTVSKSDPRVHAIGSVDETNSYVGLAIAFSENEQAKKLLSQIQKDLFKIGSILAGAKLKLSPTRTKFLENHIDKMQEALPKLQNFILPGGSKAGALLHAARVVCRRAERSIASLDSPPVQISKYTNRLSDFLFVLARHTNFSLGASEEIWKK